MDVRRAAESNFVSSRDSFADHETLTTILQHLRHEREAFAHAVLVQRCVNLRPWSCFDDITRNQLIGWTAHTLHPK